MKAVLDAPATGTREGCQGMVPLSARLEPWQESVCGRSAVLEGLIELHGSPLNLIDPSPMARNAEALSSAAAAAGVDLRIYFARKANKALGLVDEARRLGLGIDLASEQELAQVLDRGVAGADLVMTAAVKPVPLLELCVTSGTTVVLDNADEVSHLAGVAAGRAVPVALRLGPDLGDGRMPTRFGFTGGEALAVGAESAVSISGLHFHLDGYRVDDRVAAIAQAVELADGLRAQGHPVTFIDIGGGIPVSYIDSQEQWDRFWAEHRRGLLGERESLTYDGYGLGLTAHRGEIIGKAAVYPYRQEPAGGAWLAAVLDAPGVAASLRERGLQLRCEPGRALLDGCGLTVARVAHRKQRGDGAWLIGLEMNRTQCRSTSDDFMVDPLLLRPPGAGRLVTPPIEGFLVGAYCIERELLTWRRLRFPNGVAVGDIVVFPNTAGYQMHILESRSHQLPLATNLILSQGCAAEVDPIDLGAEARP